MNIVLGVSPGPRGILFPGPQAQGPGLDPGPAFMLGAAQSHACTSLELQAPGGIQEALAGLPNASDPAEPEPGPRTPGPGPRLGTLAPAEKGRGGAFNCFALLHDPSI